MYGFLYKSDVVVASNDNYTLEKSIERAYVLQKNLNGYCKEDIITHG